MTKTPVFSICIPTYNRAHVLDRAVDSALAQGFSDYELLVVDNASTDNTTEILAHYSDPRLRVIRNPSTVSMPENHNICIDLARGEWIVILHSDDRLRPDALARLAGVCMTVEHPDAIAQAGDFYDDFWSDLHGVATYVADKVSDGLLLFRYCGFNIPGACFRRETLLRHGGFKTSFMMWDWDAYFRFFEGGSTIILLHETLCEIGVPGTDRNTNRLIEDKQWLFFGAHVVIEHLHHPAYEALLPQAIASWKPAEVARLLMYIAAGNDKEALKKIEATGYPVLREAKKHPSYRHVWLFKMLGHRGHRRVVKIVAALQKCAAQFSRKAH